MSTVKKTGIVVLSTVATGLYLAAPAGADPGNDPCHSIFIPICRMVPIMPDLDHDIDLTQDDPYGMSPGQDGQATGSQPGVAGSQPGAAGSQPGAGPSGG